MTLEVSVDLQEFVTVDVGDMEDYELVETRVTSDGEIRATSDGEERIISSGTGKSEFLEVDLGSDTLTVEVESG